MPDPQRHLDRKKVFTGVILICLAVLLMLSELERVSPGWQAIWISLLGVGLGLYIWGRFFSRREE